MTRMEPTEEMVNALYAWMGAHDVTLPDDALQSLLGILAASPGQGAVTAEQLEAIVETLAEPEWDVIEIHPCYSRAWVVQRRGGDMTKPMQPYPVPADDVWRYGPYDYRNEAVAVWNRLLARQIVRTLGLQVQP